MISGSGLWQRAVEAALATAEDQYLFYDCGEKEAPLGVPSARDARKNACAARVRGGHQGHTCAERM